MSSEFTLYERILAYFPGSACLAGSLVRDQDARNLPWHEHQDLERLLPDDQADNDDAYSLHSNFATRQNAKTTPRSRPWDVWLQSWFGKPKSRVDPVEDDEEGLDDHLDQDARPIDVDSALLHGVAQAEAQQAVDERLQQEERMLAEAEERIARRAAKKKHRALTQPSFVADMEPPYLQEPHVMDPGPFEPAYEDEWVTGVIVDPSVFQKSPQLDDDKEAPTSELVADLDDADYLVSSKQSQKSHVSSQGTSSDAVGTTVQTTTRNEHESATGKADATLQRKRRKRKSKKTRAQEDDLPSLTTASTVSTSSTPSIL